MVRKMKRLICLLISLAVIMSGICRLATAEEGVSVSYRLDDNSNTVTVTVVADSAKAGDFVTLDIFYSGKTFESLISNPSAWDTVLAYRGQGVVDVNGECVFELSMNGDSGSYNACVNVDGVTASIDIPFVNVERYTSAVGGIDDIIKNTSGSYDTLAKKATAISGILTNNKNHLGIIGVWNTRFLEVSASGTAKILISLYPEGGISTDSKSSVIKSIKKAILIQMLNDGKLENVYDMQTDTDGDTIKALLEIDSYVKKAGAGTTYDTSKLSQNYKVTMTQKLSGRSFETVQAYKNRILEAFVLAAVKDNNGYLNVKQLFNDFEQEIFGKSVLSGSESTEVWTKLANNTDVDTYSALAAKYNAALPPGGGNGGGSGGSGGGGGGGTVSGGAGNVVITVQPDGADKPKPVTVKSEFSDIPSTHWAYEAITKLSGVGVINGYEDGSFKPEKNITREEFVKLISGCFDDASITEATEFTDINENDWFYNYVCFAVEKGLVNGESATSFGAGKNITRQDIATIAYRTLKLITNIENAVLDDKFSDDSKISDYAKTAVYTLKNAGVISGMPDGCFCPESPATRAETAKILARVLELIDGGEK